MPTVAINGAEIFHEEFGQGDSLILVPGLGAHSGIWGPFPRVLSAERRVVIYDPRGLGRSTAGDRELSIELMASDLKAVLDDAGIEQTIVLGVSMGALVSLRFALDYPDAASKLVLVTPSALRTRYGDWLLGTFAMLREHISPDEFVRTMASIAFAPPYFDHGFGMIKEVIKMLTPTEEEYEQIGRQLACLKESNITAELSHVETPALIIAGERDVLVPIEHARKLAAKLRHSRLVSIPDAGHSPFVEATDAVLSAINEFL